MARGVTRLTVACRLDVRPPRICLGCPLMADGSDTGMAPSLSASGLVAGVRSFAAGHGGATAVIEYVGRRGARIVLVGQDGAWGDQFAESTEVARAACAKAGVA